MRLNLFLSRAGKASSRGSLLRSILRAVGVSWEASPVRRVLQTISLTLYLVLIGYVCWPGGAPEYAEAMAARETLPAETYLLLDPLVGISAAIAARAWIWALLWAGAMLVAGMLIPRGFCGYVCPLGTIIDVFDHVVGRRFNRLKLRPRSWWAHLRYYVLAGVLLAATFGVMLSGFVSAIAVLTRLAAFTLGPLQTGLLRGWHVVPPIGPGQVVSIALFACILGASLLGRRFWCRVLCPTGAIFSAGALLRLTRRKVTQSCTQCGHCSKQCPFDAIRPDFSTRDADCTFCQTCGGVCPTGAIQFVGRWDGRDEQPPAPDQAGEIVLSRRGFLAAAAGGAVAATAVGNLLGDATIVDPVPAVRPPGSAPEREFLAMCVRCGSCMKACPTNVLQPMGLGKGLNALWTPHAQANWGGCDPGCNLCGQVCPTGAIRALPLEEKRAARMGLAVVDETTCLPHAGRNECLLCADACKHAGHDAIEFIRVGVELDEDGYPLPESGLLAPVVLSDKCVGCGLCQSRCYQINTVEKKLLNKAAIHVEAGQGKEDRMLDGSYRQLRSDRTLRKNPGPADRKDDGYLPSFLSE